MYVDLVNEKIIYSKRLPIEMEEMRLKTHSYVTDNEGNITFVAMIAKRKKDSFMNTISGIGIGRLDRKDEKVKLTEIDTKGSVFVAYSITKNKQGDIIHNEELDNNITYKQFMNERNKQNIDFTFELDKFKKENFEQESKSEPEPQVDDRVSKYLLNYNKVKNITFLNIKESSNRYFASFYHKKNFNNYHKYSVAFLSNTGEILWHKSLPYFPSVYECNYNSSSKIIHYNNKIYLFFYENKPYELTEKTKKMLENDQVSIVYDHKKENTIMISIDEKGIIDKKTINDNLTYEFDFSSEDYVSDAGNLYTEVWDSKKRILFLKQIPLK